MSWTWWESREAIFGQASPDLYSFLILQGPVGIRTVRYTAIGYPQPYRKGCLQNTCGQIRMKRYQNVSISNRFAVTECERIEPFSSQIYKEDIEEESKGKSFVE